MSPAEVLAKVLGAGGRVIPDPARPRLLVPPSLRPLVAEHREALRRLVLEQSKERSVPLPLDPLTLREVLGALCARMSETVPTPEITDEGERG